MKKVWIDTDVGGDIDDALAILLAMASPEIELIGVSTVFENTQARAKIAKTLLSLGGFGNVPVYAGEGMPIKATSVYDMPLSVSHLPKTYEESAFCGAKIEKNAVEAIHAALNEYKGLNLVTIGALTNVARLFEKYPEDEEKIGTLYIMGGAVHLNLNEFNFTSDPEAAEIVLQKKVKKKVVTLDVTFKCELDKEQIERLRACKSEVVRKVLRMSELWGEGMILHDPLTIGCLLSDEFVHFEKGNLKVETEGYYSRGKCANLCDFNWNKPGKDNLLVSEGVKAKEYCEFYVNRICEFDEKIAK